MKPRYNVGTSVEVSLPDKEWHGVWFPATILEEIDHDFFLIGYESLGLDDGCLKEVTDAVHMRPTPPENSDRKVFAVSEEVDVYYDCGWWSGQVKDILPGNRYVVWYNLQKERREFNLCELRCHMEWIKGTWVQDSQQTKGLRFNRRTPVEVCLPDKLCRGAWFPATVLEEVVNGLFWVQYNFSRLGDNEECLKDIVNAQQIRPSPPEDKNGRNFVVLEEVDVFFYFVWWEGTVTEVLAGNQYNISFKHEKKQRQFNQSELRSHMIWSNGKWVQNLQDKNAEGHQGNCRKTDQQQLQVGSAANKSNTRKRKIKHRPREPGKNLKKGGTSEGTMPDRTMIESGTYIDLVTPSPKVEEALIQKKKDISQNLIEVFVSQSEGIRFNPRKEFGKQKFSNVLDCDMSGIDFSLPSPSIIKGGEQYDLYETPVQFLQKSQLVQSPPHTPNLAVDEIQQQRGKTTTLETRGQSKDIVIAASDKDPIYTTPSTKMTEVVQTFTSEKTEMIATKALSNIEDLQPLSMCSEELYGPAMKDKQDIQQQRGEIEKETTTILERREQSKEMVSKASAEDPMNKNPSIEITVVQTECTSGRTEMIVTETLSSIEDMHPLSMCSEGALPDNRLASHSSMPITSRDVSMEGQKLQKSLFISKCSTSREHCNKAVEDVPCKTGMHENRDPMNKTSSKEIAEVVQTECTSGRTEINVTETLSSIEDLQPQSMCSEDLYGPARKDNSVAPDNGLPSHPNTPITSREVSKGGREVQNSSYASKYYMRRKHCKKAVEEVPYSIGMHENRGEITFENGNLPFVKSHPLWENLESRDIFHLTLHRPHFQTLLECNEWLREGQALGYMVSFVDIVEKTSKAQVNVPKSDLEKILKALDDLKPFGFNVHPVCSRVKELLEVQDTIVELDEKLKEIARKLVKETYVKELLNSEVNEINDELRKLQESVNEINKEREKAIMEMQTIGSSIIELQKRFHETKNDIYAINLDFDRVAATPW
ncbi:hypothetical protein FRX31_012165 [Thalictrum thalictroides]|uniref:Agenet domain-containing protein n=1 Tax=Thalictrum thalictroides TaxID=46969 RepID=A0A7J6WLK0_THATH|nr:hypothetical protein FRX31_012165 [Thalictrum thalictroides]